jgi:hypothetical protein
MIEYSSEGTERDLMYFAGDGSWGDASDVAIIDITELDGHFTEFIDELHDYQRPDFMRWYVENQTHDQQEHSYTACRVCEQWDSGTEDKIIEILQEEE